MTTKGYLEAVESFPYRAIGEIRHELTHEHQRNGVKDRLIFEIDFPGHFEVCILYLPGGMIRATFTLDIGQPLKRFVVAGYSYTRGWIIPIGDILALVPVETGGRKKKE